MQPLPPSLNLDTLYNNNNFPLKLFNFNRFNGKFFFFAAIYIVYMTNKIEKSPFNFVKILSITLLQM